MRLRIRYQLALLLTLAAVSTRPTVAQTPAAQSEPVGDKRLRLLQPERRQRHLRLASQAGKLCLGG